MIIEQKIQHEIVEDDFLTIKSKVNQKKLVKLYGLLSNIYRNPIGAIVREYASNAYDANVEARNFATLTYEEIRKKYSWVKDSIFNMDEKNFKLLGKSLTRVSEKEPVVVGITEINNQLFFYVKDYGIGLSPERMMNIYFNYLDSTKEDTDDEIGGFGIGSKSALSYTHTFYIDTVYMGISYKYIMSKDAEGIPQGQLLYKSEYDETLENGTTIKIQLKETSDAGIFFNEVPKQLSYMDNLYFDNEYFKDNSYLGLTYSQRTACDSVNDFKLYRGDGWLKKSMNQPYDELHICLGKVSYTIDWTELGMVAIREPLAITFNVGELQPTPSRESILYTPHSIKLIKDRIKYVQDFFINEYYKLFKTTDDLQTFIDRRDNTINSVTIGDVTIKIADISDIGDSIIGKSKIKYKPFEDAGFKKIPLNSSLFNGFHINKKISHSTARMIFNKYANNIPSSISRPMYFDDKGKTKFNFHRNAYFMENKMGSHYCDLDIIERVKDFDYDLLLQTDVYYKGDEVKQKEIKKVFIREIEKLLRSKSVKYDKYYPDPNWQHSFDVGKSKFSPKAKIKRLKGKIFAYAPNNWGSYNQSEHNLEDIQSFKGIVIYDKHENKAKLLEYFMLLSQVKTLLRKDSSYINTKALKCISVSKTNYKLIEQMDNTMTPEEVLRSVRVFKRVSTAMLIKDRFINLKRLIKIDGCYDKVDLSYDKLKIYIRDNFKNRNFSNDVLISEDFINGMLLVAKNRNMIDLSIVKELEFLEDYNNDLDLLNSFVNNPTFNQSMVEFLKLKGKRVSNKYYLK